MSSFPPAAVALLERIVEKGEVDGWPPSRIMKDPAYSAMFSTISPGTFRSRLTRIRSKYGKPNSRKRKTQSFFIPFHASNFSKGL